MNQVATEQPKLFSRKLPWNPLTDDGDVLLLAVKLRIEFCGGAGDGPEVWAGDYKKGLCEAEVRVREA